MEEEFGEEENRRQDCLNTFSSISVQLHKFVCVILIMCVHAHACVPVCKNKHAFLVQTVLHAAGAPFITGAECCKQLPPP